MTPPPRVVRGALMLWTAAVLSAGAQNGSVESYRETAQRIIDSTRNDPFAWNRLAEMTDTFGHRLSGSPGLEAALRWSAEELKKDGLENVRLEKVMVPRWVRGKESVEIVEPFPSPLVMLGLGNSVGTPADGIQAEVVIVKSFEELDKKAADVKGRFVLYNVEYTSYGETVRYRGAGASRAAKLGAVGMLLRSVGPIGLRTPHTGSLRYDEDSPKIPGAAITAEDANRLQRIHDRGRRIVVRLKMEAQFLPDSESANVIGEIRGREKPEEIVLVGGHMDSWDAATGAMDDGGGVIATWDALRVIKKLGLRPRRTLRFVGFTNEENGGRGGQGYRDQHKDEIAKHVVAIESDNGAFRLRGFGFTGPAAGRTKIEEIAKLLEPLGASEVGATGGGADIAPLAQAATAAGLVVPTMSPIVEGSRYFIYHHTPADTVERLDPQDIASCVAGVAVMAYVIADLPARIVP